MIPANKDFDNQNIKRATLRFPLNTQVFAFWESRMQTFFIRQMRKINNII